MTRSRTCLLLTAVALAAAAPFVGVGSAAAGRVEAAPAVADRWEMLRPSNTGIPGNDVLSVAVDRRDRTWVTGEDPIFDEGGLGREGGRPGARAWRTWTNVDGTSPTHHLRRLAFDAEGTPWAASDQGLVRLAGKKVRVVWSAQNAPWPTSAVRDFDWDSRGRLWVALEVPGSVRGAVARHDGRRWKVWTNDNGLPFGGPYDAVSTLEVDDRDRVWIGSPLWGGAVFADGSWTRLGDQGGWAYDIAIGPDGTAWFGFAGQGVRSWDGTAWTDRTGVVGSSVYDVSVDRSGRVWVGTARGLVHRWSGSGAGYDVTLDPPSISRVYEVAFDRHDRARVVGIGGLDTLRADGTWDVSVSTNTGLTERWFVETMIASNGDVWFPTGGGGIARLDDGRWTGFNPGSWGTAPWPFQTDSVQAAVEGPDGTIWIAPAAHGVGAWDGGRWVEHLPFARVESLAVDPAGRVWAMPERGPVQVWDGSGWTTMGNPPNPTNWHIAADVHGDVWVASSTGLQHFDGETWRTYGTAHGLPSQQVTTVTPEPTGDAVWVGTEAGLARFDGEDATVWTKADGLPADDVSSIAFGPDGRVWVGAFDYTGTGGVAVRDGDVWVAYTPESSPLPHKQVEHVTVGPDGRVWIGTASEGIAVLTPGAAS